MGDLRIPDRLARTVVAWEGDPGRRWLRDLPGLVDAVATTWDLEVGEPFEPGGQISWVAPARRRADGLEAVLKVQFPHLEAEPEADGLRAWAGEGAVLLHDHDAAHHALLLERCNPGTGLGEAGGDDGSVAAGARVGARLHTAAVPPGLPTLASVLDPWADHVEARLVQMFVDPGLERRAVATMRDRPRAEPAPVLLHGDLNPTNVLAAERAPWLAIDPKPMVGEAAYDGTRLVTQPDPLATADPAATLGRRLHIVSDEMGIERGALAEWCLADLVQMGTSARAHGDGTGAVACAELVGLLVEHLP